MKKLVKKLAIAFLTASLAITAMAPTTMAKARNTSTQSSKRTSKSVQYVVKKFSGTYYVSNKIGVNVRQKPTEHAVRLGGLYYGNKVVVTGRVYVNNQYTGWVRINYNGGSAFIISRVLSKTNPTPTPTPSKTVYTVKVQKGYLALRTQPKYDSKNEIAKLHTGDKVVLLKKYNSNYWYVRVSSTGKCGYVNCKYLV